MPFFTSTQRQYLKLLLSIAPAVALEQVISASVNMVDTMMIGQAMGVSEVAAVGLANQILFLFILVTFGLISGSTVFSGQYFGDGDMASVHKIMGIGFGGNLVVALIFFVPAFFVPELLIGIYSSDPVVIEMGAGFLRITSFSYFFMAIVFTRNSAMRSVRQTKLPMLNTAVALLVNVVLNYLVLFVFELGLAGVAWSTLAVRFLELVLQQVLIWCYRVPIQAKLKAYFDFDLSFVRGFFKVAVFILFNEITWALGNSAYHIAFGIVGTEAQGTMQMSMSVVNLFQVLGNSVAISTSIMISNTLGAGKLDLAKVYARYCMWFTLVAAIGMGLMLMALAEPVARFYGLEPDIHHAVVLVLRVAAATMLVRTLNFTIIVGILRSGGDTKYCFFLELGTVYLIGLPLGFAGAIMGLPVHVVYLLMMSEELTKLVIALRRVLGYRWANKLV